MYKHIKYVLVFVVIMTTTIAEAQCAMCKAVVENGDVGMAEGVNSGITYLMVFPYILVGLLFFFIYRYRKTAKN